MATNLTSPKHLAAQIESIGRGLMDESRRVAALEKTVESLLADGVAPLTVKSYIDTLLAGSKAVLQRYGDVLGDTTTPSNPTLPMSFATRWKAGAPAGAGYYRVGYGSSYATNGAKTQSLHTILVSEVGPNADMFLGVKRNDVIRVEGCADYRNNGRYTVAYDVDEVGDGGSTYGLENGDFGAGTGWTTSGGWSIGSGVATYTSTSATTPITLTNALTGCVANGAYRIQFDLAITAAAASGTIKVSLGGSWYWERTFDATMASTTFSFVADSPSTTPTLTISATREDSGTDAFTAVLDNVFIQGWNGLFVVEPFYSDAGSVSGESPYNDTGVVITLEQTAA